MENNTNEDDKEADFEYGGLLEFDPEFNPLGQLKYEKERYKRGILPKLKEIEEGKEKEIDDSEVKEFLLRTKDNHRNIKFKYENGEVYPKDIPFPDIRFIQYAEPHVLITDWYDDKEEWYGLREIIKDFAEESYLSYEKGLWFASISSAINCCEYILKYELFRYLKQNNKEELEKASKDYYLTLGKLKDNLYGCLDLLEIKDLFLDKLNYINLVRNSIYHFNPEKSKKVSEKGEIEIEKNAPIIDDHVKPIIAFKVYSIMIDLINHFYTKEKSIKFIHECINDWMEKRNLTKEDFKDDK